MKFLALTDLVVLRFHKSFGLGCFKRNGFFSSLPTANFTS